MVRPVLMAVDDEPTALRVLEAELGKDGDPGWLVLWELAPGAPVEADRVVHATRGHREHIERPPRQVAEVLAQRQLDPQVRLAELLVEGEGIVRAGHAAEVEEDVVEAVEQRKVLEVVLPGLKAQGADRRPIDDEIDG